MTNILPSPARQESTDYPSQLRQQQRIVHFVFSSFPMPSVIRGPPGAN